jgi:hypothetical protein
VVYNTVDGRFAADEGAPVDTIIKISMKAEPSRVD